ncbi:myelin and lymphocyte protein isoform X1 [Symphalangus syndactylus]|uniref:myelin and lymphocyte protein isoform X1 n=1 Tax=Symphalangus syndactylus TaxID=9590 RepID=UPI003006DFF6
MAPAAASGGSTLPSGFSVFTTFPDLLFIFEFIFGGLVWILVASSLVPWPLVQGWVMFVSVFCFVATTTLIILYIIGAHSGETSWVTLDAAYHCTAALFYLSASVLEALATITMQDGFTYRHYHENIAAVMGKLRTQRKQEQPQTTQPSFYYSFTDYTSEVGPISHYLNSKLYFLPDPWSVGSLIAPCIQERTF